MASEVKWIKITTDIFDDEKILLIESLPDSYAIIVCWFKLLCLAGKQNNSGVFMMGDKIAYTDKMLATIFRMKESTVQMSLQTFEQFGMVEIVDGVITIPNWGKHQNLEQLEARRNYQREYQKEYRQKQKLIASAEENRKCLHKHLHKDSCKQNINSPDIDIDKEIDRDIDVYNTVVSYLNQKAGTAYRSTTAKTKSAINARLAEGFNVDDFKAVIDKKCAEWIGTEWEKFLRPETLFGTKFEIYLNAKAFKKQAASNHAELTDLDDIF